tara:strand:+ start:56 stop:226 length:171 start_codon:yes stop_codon:yes gene_type:complete
MDKETLVKLHFNLRNDFLEACDQSSDGEIITTEKAKGIGVAIKRVVKLLNEVGVTV